MPHEYFPSLLNTTLTFPRWRKEEGPSRSDAELLKFLGAEGVQRVPCEGWHGPWYYCTGFCERPSSRWDDVWLDEDHFSSMHPRAPRVEASMSKSAFDDALRELGMLAEGTRPRDVPIEAGKRWWKVGGACRPTAVAPKGLRHMSSKQPWSPVNRTSLEPKRDTPCSDKALGIEGVTTIVPSTPLWGSGGLKGALGWGGTKRSALNPSGKPWATRAKRGANANVRNRHAESSKKGEEDRRVRLHGCLGWSKEELAELLTDYGDVEHISLKKDTAIVMLTTSAQASHVAAECDLTPFNIHIEYFGKEARTRAGEEPVLEQNWAGDAETDRPIPIDDGRDAQAQAETRHREILYDVLGDESDLFQWDVYHRLLDGDHTEADAFLLALEVTLQAQGLDQGSCIPVSQAQHDDDEEEQCPICGVVMKRSQIEAHAWDCMETTAAAHCTSTYNGSPKPHGATIDIDASCLDDMKKISWWYVDDDGLEQGPYSSQDMRAWWEAGYFEPNRKVRTSSCSEYAPIEERYASKLSEAFSCLPAPESSFLETKAACSPDDGQCPFCGLSFPPSLLEAHVMKHIELQHQETGGGMRSGSQKESAAYPLLPTAMASCPICGVKVASDIMDAHVESCLSEAAIMAEQPTPQTTEACASFPGEHGESLGNACSAPPIAMSTGRCPVCDVELPLSQLEAHVNAHFA